MTRYTRPLPAHSRLCTCLGAGVMAAASLGRRLLSATRLTAHLGSSTRRALPQRTCWRHLRGSVALAAEYSSKPAPPGPDYRFTKSHEWVSVEGTTATIGISNYAQDKLGEVVFVELPEVGADIASEDQLGVLESVKAVAEVYSPISGKVTDINGELENTPDLINKDPYGQGWLTKLEVEDAKEVDGLMTEEQYKQHLSEGI